MEPLPPPIMDVPANCRICVSGKINSSWAQSFWGRALGSVQDADDQAQTVLIDETAGHATLIGIINALYNFGHAVVSVERVTVDVNIDENDKQEER